MNSCDSGSVFNLEYRGEGSAAMVFALPKSNQVLRIFKSEAILKISKEIGVVVDNEASRQQRIREQLENVVDYMNNIMRPLFAGHYVLVPTLTQLPPGFSNRALSLTVKERPAHRKSSKTSEDAENPWAFVLPDCCFVHNSNASVGDLSGSHSPVSHDGLSPLVTADGVNSECNEGMSSGCAYQEPGSKLQGMVLNGTHSHIGKHPGLNENSGSKLISSTVMADMAMITASKASNTTETTSDILDQSKQQNPYQLQDGPENFTLSFEVKPKKAFMSVTKQGQSQVCKFCMHQCLKSIRTKVSPVGYANTLSLVFTIVFPVFEHPASTSTLGLTTLERLRSARSFRKETGALHSNLTLYLSMLLKVFMNVNIHFEVMQVA
ncbi:inositol-pentakisphosphate 2-kinase [Plakobranchus ocellatus]|uniref:Inositol-pentakisphosphate 2-kinase n=1 Tax=Plakobranchus ocellatus TaxID=259542 RepID=A0AAV4DLU2_9GAST|nr:inositol-pentakisphosphate 2-kinase [Plakobranchus ocellatus]